MIIWEGGSFTGLRISGGVATKMEVSMSLIDGDEDD